MPFFFPPERPTRFQQCSWGSKHLSEPPAFQGAAESTSLPQRASTDPKPSHVGQVLVELTETFDVLDKLLLK